MKRTLTALKSAASCLCLMLCASSILFAQDTLDVAQGYETLNLAIEGDTLADGSPASMNRVWRLQRGGVYLLNGTISGNGSPLRIVAAEGDGPRPLLISTADQTGFASRYFRPGVDAEWKGLYISGIDNLGKKPEDNTFRLEKKGGRYVIDDVVADGDDQAFVRMNAEGQKLYVTNTIFANAFRVSNPDNGRFIDTRGNTQDTIFVQNCTFYVGTQRPIRSGGGIIKNIVVDHVTFDKPAGWPQEFELGKAINCQFTNNLLRDMGYEGRELMAVDSTNEVVIPIETLGAVFPDSQRVYQVKNNVMGWSPEVKAWILSKDSLELYTWHDKPTEQLIATFPNMISENNIFEDVQFSDGPESALIVAYSEHRYNDNRNNNNNPDIRHDRNGVGTLQDNPETFGPAADDYNFDYASTYAAYTHAEGGFPAGDLNWFPDKLAAWRDFVSSVDADDNRPMAATFALEQNYPNPFNPSTTIAYHLRTAAAVKLTVYNVLGQKVRALVNERRQQAGTHRIQWDGRDDAGRAVTSGMYLYRLETDDQAQTKSMLLLK